MIYDYLSADEAYRQVLAGSGTVNRDQVECRIVNEVRTGTSQFGGAAKGANSGIIDTERDAEGFISYATDYVVPTDTDGDGMPDEWERKHGLDPYVADQNKVNADGYTALEVYLNALMGEKMADDSFTTNIVEVKSGNEIGLAYSQADAVLSVGKNALGGLLSIYSVDGKLLSTQTISAERISLRQIPARILLLKVQCQGYTPRVLKVVK